jgi:hypothetical protein
MEPILTKLSPDAASFMRTLRALEYLQSPIDQMLHTRLLHLFEHNGIIELKDLKRCMAELLFEHKEKLPDRLQGFLYKDWPMLFG